MGHPNQRKAEFITPYAAAKRRQVIAAILFMPFMLLFVLFAGVANTSPGMTLDAAPLASFPVLGVALIVFIIYNLNIL